MPQMKWFISYLVVMLRNHLAVMTDVGHLLAWNYVGWQYLTFMRSSTNVNSGTINIKAGLYGVWWNTSC